MRYHVEWIENKTGKSGKNYQVMTLKDETGAMFENVSTFDTLSLAGDYEGEIIQNGQYLNFKMKMANPYPKPAGRGTNIAQAQERKAEFIHQAQDRKNESIAYFNAVNSAISMLSALGIKQELPIEVNGQYHDNVKSLFVHWRDWFLEEWRKYEAADQTTKRNPF